MQFVNDMSEWYGRSKFNRIAEICASYMHGIRYYSDSCAEPVIIQAGDGIMQSVPASCKCRRQLILHDWNDRYADRIGTVDRIYCMGNFRHPKFSRPAMQFESCVVDTSMHVPPGKLPYSVIVGGEACQSDRDYIVDSVNSVAKPGESVFIACPAIVGSDVLAETERILSSMGFSVSHDDKCSRHKVETLYVCADRIVHCGSGTRGYLHSLAVKYCGNVITKTGDNEFVPSDVHDLIKFFK